eukprot:CAMPEP_0184020812 /NCGR_PEP_ID=MMETSP0954-20121128/9563_1 /TAXON_ID=627963 /ORGANISM="Aplanochytrium sp, Strain PBS07" /LENGTH=54 /DNA_ID=CAMNT_0026302727 /DNA_START=1579 /DNA_END=1743 /DNA_ORIENTATION=+
MTTRKRSGCLSAELIFVPILIKLGKRALLAKKRYPLTNNDEKLAYFLGSPIITV